MKKLPVILVVLVLTILVAVVAVDVVSAQGRKEDRSKRELVAAHIKARQDVDALRTDMLANPANNPDVLRLEQIVEQILILLEND